MSVRIRLRRMGAKKKPFYRIVVADQRSPRNGRFIDLLGTYDPTQDPPAVKLDTEKAQKWISNGAQPSDVVKSLFAKQGIGDAPVRFQKPAKVVEAPAVEEAPVAEAAPEAAPEAAAEETAPAEEAPAAE